MEQYRSLILRGNRALGSYLAEHNFITDEQFAKANERLMDLLTSNQLRQANLIHILCHEKKTIPEDNIVAHIVEDHSVGLIDLAHIKLRALESELGYERDLCVATGTLPFEFLDGIVCLATTSYLSKPVVKHWEDLLRRPVFWYATDTISFARAIEKLSELDAAKTAATP